MNSESQTVAICKETLENRRELRCLTSAILAGHGQVCRIVAGDLQEDAWNSAAFSSLPVE